MGKSRLPPEAFEYYVGLGIERSYQTVATQFGVTKRTVATHAKTDRWKERLTHLQSGALDGMGEHSRLRVSEDTQRHQTRTASLQDALHEVVSLQRVKALLAVMLKAALNQGDMQTARFLFERVFGRLRHEPLSPRALDLSDGLSTSADVRRVANELLQGVAAGAIAPEDAQRAASVVETARRSIETEDLEKRIAAIEDEVKKDKRR